MASAYEGDSHDLRIVLLEISGAGKSSTGNAILGRKAFKESRTRESEIQRGRVDDRNISIIDTPGFFNTQLTDEEMKQQMMESLDLAHPGPHVFLLVINLENFREEKRNIVEEIEEIFGAQVFKFTLVLFTGREQMSNREWTVFRHSTKFQELVSRCRDNYYEINSKNQVNQTHITELLDKIDEFIKQNNHQHYNSRIFSVSRTKSIRIKKKQEEEKTYKRKEQEMKQKQAKTTWETSTTYSSRKERTTHTVTEVSYVSQTMKTTHMYEKPNNKSLDRFQEFSNEGIRDKKKGLNKTPEKSWGMSHKMKYQIRLKDDLRIVLLGKTGAGKSATGNTILREKLFNDKYSLESVTKECQKHQQMVDCQNISVIDTPGQFDTSTNKEQLKRELVKCVEMSVPGPHVFLLVIRLDMRFTEEEKNTVKWIQENFGKDAARYTIVLFTRGDQLPKPIDEFLTENKQINELVSQCDGGYHVFDNTNKDPKQVTKLLNKIEIMVTKNGGKHYTNDMYKKAQRKIMMKKVQETALVGASVAGVGAAVAGGAVLVAATGGVALPVALMAGGAFLTGGSGAAKAIAQNVKHIRGNRRSSKDQDRN